MIPKAVKLKNLAHMVLVIEVKTQIGQSKQHVVINREKFTWIKVASEVSRNEFWARFFFLVYINTNSVNKLCELADDAQLLGNPLIKDDKIPKDLNAMVSFWSDTGLLNFNSKRFKFIQVGSRNHQFTYKMANTAINNVYNKKLRNYSY